MSLIPVTLRTNPVVISGRSVREMVAARTVTEIVPGTPGTPDVLGPAEYASGAWRDPATGRSYSVRVVGPRGVGGSWVNPLTGALIPITVTPGTPGTPAQTVVRELPPFVTVGLAYAGGAAGTISVGGSALGVLANASGALAVTRLENRAGRIWGVLCNGSGPVQTSVSSLVPLPIGSEYQSPFDTRVRVRFLVSGSGTLALFLTGNGKLETGRRVEGQNVISFFQDPITGARQDLASLISSSTGVVVYDIFPGTIISRRGQTVGPPIVLDFGLAPTWTPDWRPAVRALAWAQTGLPWWGPIDAGARAGLWVRRSVWASGRKVRFEAGAGTERAVAVTESGARVTTGDFTAEDFLAGDWLFADTVGEPSPIDVTDWVFSGPSGSVAFAVVGSEVVDPLEPPDPPSVRTYPAPPSAGDWVLMARNGREEWVPTVPFACPVGEE